MGFFDHLMRDIRSVTDRDGGQNAIPPLHGALSPNDRLDACVPIGVGAAALEFDAADATQDKILYAAVH